MSNLFGLVNDASCCYLNSLIQCIFTFSNFMDHINDEPAKPTQKFYYQLYNLCKTIKNNPNKILNPNSFKIIFIRSKNNFNYGQQQDAEEFLNHFFDKIHEDTKFSPDIDNILSIIDAETDTAIYNYINNYKDNDYSHLVTGFFHHQLRKKYKCNNCNHTNFKFEVNSQLYLTPTKQRCTLEECIDNFLKPELLDGYKCDSCQLKNTTSISTSISRFPINFIIVLKKYGSYKSIVEFPLELDLLSTMIKTDKLSHKKITPKIKGSYHLTGITCHYGSVNTGGHYNAICKKNNEWYLIDDARVHKIKNITTSVMQSAYMLFYERVG